MLVFAAILLLSSQLALAAPPAWQCGVQRDYFAKETTLCADASCNAAQRNLGGDVLVLDTKSYGAKGGQGFNLDIPATCCQSCKDTDGCNAWVVCTNKDGCGSGCQAYAKQFKQPLSYYDRLPHRFWGNWGGCSGDKWPFGMCSLKVVKDTKNPPVVSAQASEGWVSGIVPKTAADGRCPATLSAKSCKACLATKDPSKCFSCIQAANRLDGPAVCTTCASLPTASGRDTCVACVTGPSSGECGQCLDADCDTACRNALQQDRTKAPNLASVDRCFACQAAAAKAAAGKPGVSTEKGGAAASSSAKAVACAKCFDAASVPAAGRDQCVSAVVSPGATAASAAGAAACADTYVTDKARCQGCASKARSVADGQGCASCSMGGRVPASFMDACFKCVLTSPDEGAKSYCSNLDSDTNEAAVAALHKCLATAKGPDAPGNCWQCYRSGDNASAAACYACLGKVGGPNGIHCSHCWVPSRMASKAAENCEKCVIGKDKAGQEGSSCWSR